MCTRAISEHLRPAYAASRILCVSTSNDRTPRAPQRNPRAPFQKPRGVRTDVEVVAVVRTVAAHAHVDTGSALAVVHPHICVADVGCLEHLVVSVGKMVAVRVEEIRHKRHLVTSLCRVCFVVASMLGAARGWLR
jgi:hypothetical protein